MSAVFPEQWAQMVKQHPEVLAGSSGRYLVYEVPDPERWIPHGYAIAHIDARGTGRSPGMWSPFSLREATDFAETIEWLADQPWCNGKVGVLGVSFHAMAAWRVAAQQPAHLAAMIPWYGAGDPYREAWRHGGILSNTFVDAWWYRWLGNQHGAGEGRASPLTGESTTGPEVLDEAQRRRMRSDLPAQARSHPLLDDWNAAAAVDWSRVTVPFLSVGNWSSVGLHLRGNIEAFRHAASTEKWLILLAANGSGLERFHDQAGIALQRRFFDHYLKGDGNDWPEQPRVTYELRDGGSSLTRRSATTWPLENTHWLRLHLDLAQHALSREQPALPAQQQYWPTSNGITVRTAPFERRTEVIGPLALRLQVSTQADDLDVFASLRVLDADGCVTGPTATRGWLRLSHRALDDQASTPHNPVHAHTRMSEVTAGTQYGIDLEMWPTSVVVPEGGRLLLSIQGCDGFDTGEFRHNDAGDRSNAALANWTTLHTGEELSWLLIPVIE